jgi:hypothetical protein
LLYWGWCSLVETLPQWSTASQFRCSIKMYRTALARLAMQALESFILKLLIFAIELSAQLVYLVYCNVRVFFYFKIY